jgi:tricorn protease
MRSDRLFAAILTLLAPVLLLVLPAASARAGEGYLRHPDIHGDLVVFNAEEDLWTVPAGGGTALRLTSHGGAEYFPRFSPDGATVAFTGEYDGNLDVYVVPVTGGEPRRLTWHSTRDEVVGWMPGGAEILFRSRREHPHGSWEMFAVPLQGGDPRKLPIGRCARLAIDPASGRWAINRLSREMSTWKRYRGGTNPDIWVGHPDRNDFARVTSFSGWDAFPMWRDGRIFFLSDQGGTANLWSMMPDGTDRQRLTAHESWDIRWPEMGPDGRIVYMLAGDLRLFDPGTGEDRAIDVTLASESVLTRRRYPSSTRRLEHVDLSPDGERVAIVTRGEVFSVPVEKGVTLAVSAGSGAREKWASFDGEGEKIVYVTDAPGEEEIREIDAWGRGEPRTIKPAGESGWLFPPVASPDGEWIAWSDQTQTLWVMKREGGSPIRVDRSPQEEIRQYTWSPDSRWLAYSRYGHTDFPSVYIYDTKENVTRAVTGPTTIDWSPAWDPDGRWLAFLSDRTINPLFGQRDFQNIEFRPTKPYLLLLKKDGKSPFRKDAGLPPEDGDGKDKKKDDKKKDKKDKDGDEDEDKKPEPIEIDWDGLEDRVVEVPLDAGLYQALSADAGHLYMLSFPVSGMREPSSEGPRGSLVMYDLEEEEDKKVAGGVSAYEVEPGAKKLLFQKKRGDLYVIDAGSPAPDDLSEHSVSLDDVVIELHPREEWTQIYWEGWRHMRDFYWDENMAGVDWKAVGDQYATLLPRLAVRDDLRDLMGELIGELNTSHTYVWGGDRGERPESVPVGMLGADVVREGNAYRIATIYRGDPADETRAPLDAPDLDVKEGEYILAVNRRPFAADRPFAAAFENTAGKQVLLSIAASTDGKNPRDVVVTPAGDERRIRYVDWVRREREAVAEATDGKIGYIHLPDMGTGGLSEFNRWFYPQMDKEGMVVDCRWNGGGFVSQMIVERFRRKIVSFDRSRAGGVFPYPYRTLNGPFVVLLNEEAGSDGDIFPYVCQYEGLAPVIGQRSWGGVVGIRADKALVDGGTLTQPEYAWWDETRGWAIENHGVDPDIVVENLPHDEGRGIDAQLLRGIEEVLRLHAENPPIRATFEDPIPDKSRGAYRSELN